MSEAESQLAAVEETSVPARTLCPRCGYNLAGLRTDGKCPECAAPIEHAMNRPLLRFASEDYLRSVHRGVFLVLAGIIVQILAVMGSFFGQLYAAFSAGANLHRPVGVLSSIVSTVASIAVLWGWWLVSTPDRGVPARFDARRARLWVRTTVGMLLGAAVVNLLSELLPPPSPASIGARAALALLMALVWLGAWVSAFFAQMVYVRWLARRIPNPKAVKRAHTMMWLGPVLATAGAVVFMLGPIVALVLYWNLLEWVRVDLKRIRKGLAPTAPDDALPA